MSALRSRSRSPAAIRPVKRTGSPPFAIDWRSLLALVWMLFWGAAYVGAVVVPHLPRAAEWLAHFSQGDTNTR